MKKNILFRAKNIASRTVLLWLVFVCITRAAGVMVQAEEAIPISGVDGAVLAEAVSEELISDNGETEDAASIWMEGEPGTYVMEEGWSEDLAQSTDSVRVYRQDMYADQTETSTILCSYLDTNYSMQEYEQLREMLTNNLLYSNVNAQISTSAVYTLAKDYLYIILVDDSSEEYRDIYHYVVGDYQCFCVQVKEYRDDAKEAQALDVETPQEAGRKVAENFVWNAAG